MRSYFSISVVLIVGVCVSACSGAPPSLAPDTGGSADAGRDGSARDVGVDASARDVGVDASAFDVGVDAGAVDAGRDASAMDVGSDAASDAGPPCMAPLSWTADTSTEATATAAVTALAPGATPTWDDARGTFSSILMLNVPIACPAGTDLWDALMPFVTSHPDIFQIDLTQWRTPSSYPCAAVGTSIDFARLDRRQLGPGLVAEDFISFAIVRNASGVQLRSIVGYYLPPVPSDVAAEMMRCGGLSVASATSTVRSETFPYSTYDLCAPTGSGVYMPGVLDLVALDPPTWSWSANASGTGVDLTSEQTGTLTIDPSYVTPALQASDANCPNDTDTGRVYGFRLTFDTTTGEILSKLPGLGCIVC